MSSPRSVGAVRKLWYRWKSLNLPWRKWRLAGVDLSGNKFWEFKDALVAGRLRRITQQNPRLHYSDMRISPAWSQWLRHTRETPPSLEEQHWDVQRQMQLKQLAALADERWKSKPSFLDAPPKDPARRFETVPRDPGGYAGKNTEPDKTEGVRQHIAGVEDASKEVKQEAEVQVEVETKEQVRRESEEPWQAGRQKQPSEEWKPQAWSPPAARRRGRE